MRTGQFYTPKCRWCGEVKSCPARMAGEAQNPKTRRYQCLNSGCPRKGQVPWRLPELKFPEFDRRSSLWNEDDPVFDNAVRALEDT